MLNQQYFQMNIDQIFDNVHKLPDTSKQLFLTYIKEVNFPKGHILLKAKKKEKNIYFIKKGIVRAYSKTENNEITFWFGKEGDAILSMKSYVSNQKGYEDIELLENCELYKLNTEDLQKLFKENIHISNWGRKFAEQELIKTEERLISRQFRTAKERYKEFIEQNPDLIQRVSLGNIASYLGITQVTLSRIRSEII